MGSFSDYLENKLLDHIFKVASYSQPTNLFVALLTATPNDSDTGSTLAASKEVSGGSYARVTCNTWNAASSGATSNTNAITFEQATANWGTIVAFAICDHISTGNMLAWGTLTESKAVVTGNIVSFAAGELDVSLD